MPDRNTRWTRPVLRASFVPILGLALLACQDPAGLPPTLDAGSLSFTYTGRINGSFSADGRCYYAQGYPAADSACALAFEVGDTLRLRAVTDPRTPQWTHVNVELPIGGQCVGGDPCGIALDFLTTIGKSEDIYIASDPTVTVTESAGGRIRGTFSGLAVRQDGAPGDTIRIFDGAFDVPLDR